MAKYKHHPDTLVVLRDLENRITQLIEAGESARANHPELAEHQRRAFESCRTLVQQCIDYGHVFRGSSFVPDGLEPYYETPSPLERLERE